MTCPRCACPGAHILMGDCIRALKARLAAKDALVERLRLRVEAERRAGAVNLKELRQWRALHRKAVAA